MAKWSSKSLEPPVSPDSEKHIAAEDIARLADGSVKDPECEELLYHINRCPRCYRILDNTLKDSQFARSGHRTAGLWWKTKFAYALAASIILIVIISGQFTYRYLNPVPKIITATLDLDQKLTDILLEDDALRFGKGARLNRLLAVLQQAGLPLKDLDLVVLAKPYYQKKSLFGPREILRIRIENGVAYLEVQEKK
jgi:hypothetical protein